jgi:hypothetical protein
MGGLLGRESRQNSKNDARTATRERSPEEEGVKKYAKVLKQPGDGGKLNVT